MSEFQRLRRETVTKLVDEFPKLGGEEEQEKFQNTPERFIPRIDMLLPVVLTSLKRISAQKFNARNTLNERHSNATRHYPLSQNRDSLASLDSGVDFPPKSMQGNLYVRMPLFDLF